MPIDDRDVIEENDRAKIISTDTPQAAERAGLWRTKAWLLYIARDTLNRRVYSTDYIVSQISVGRKRFERVVTSEEWVKKRQRWHAALDQADWYIKNHNSDWLMRELMVLQPMAWKEYTEERHRLLMKDAVAHSGVSEIDIAANAPSSDLLAEFEGLTDDEKAGALRGVAGRILKTIGQHLDVISNSKSIGQTDLGTYDKLNKLFSTAMAQVVEATKIEEHNQQFVDRPPDETEEREFRRLLDILVELLEIRLPGMDVRSMTIAEVLASKPLERGRVAPGLTAGEILEELPKEDADARKD